MRFDTPRTDEQAGALIDAEEVVPAWFARELERENAALKIKCNKLRLALEDIEEASVDPWAKIAADRVLKEAQS